MKQRLLIALCSLAIISCNKSDDPIPVTDNNMESPKTPGDSPGAGVVIKSGTFTGYEHNLMGKVSLFVDSTTSKYLRLEQFTMTQGPDVRVYLSRSNNYSKANVIEVKKLTEGYSNQAFNVYVTSLYSDQYQFVLVYCLQYNALFGYAELK